MTLTLRKPAAKATPIHLTGKAGLARLLASLPAEQRRWAESTGFRGADHTHLLLPDAQGGLAAVLAGAADPSHPYALSALPKALPAGRYRLVEDGPGLSPDAQAAAHSWVLGGYRFGRYRSTDAAKAELMLPSSDAAKRGQLLALTAMATRDLVNTPAEHLGPAELAAAVKAVGQAHGAKVKETVGAALLKAKLPAIHAVGRAATQAPRLIELTWGSPKAPRLSIVGKGVCFDSGGLDIKPAAGMRNMKKDMGGAANALALASLVMALKLPVRLQLLIPAVENAIAGNAYRPGDVIPTRAGLQVEIGNTDAEGRVILCDALALAAEGQPDLIIDMATLTGAARVALGGQLPALFSRDTALARELVDSGIALHDPMWQLPLWAPYHADIESDIGDIVNTGRSPQAGAITAALFLADFVPESIAWLHLDLYAWNDGTRPGRPAGGEQQAVRTLLAMLERRYRG